MVACLSCFERIPDNKYQFACRSGKCEEEPDLAASAYLGVAQAWAHGEFEYLRQPNQQAWPPQRPVCPECKEQLAELCPVCHEPLPDGWRTFDVTTIAMCGARASGKSVYISVLVQQLKRWLSDTMRTAMRFPLRESEEIYNESYFKPLYAAGATLQGTPDLPPPIVLELGQLKGLRRVLVIRDIAGEMIQDVGPDTPKRLRFLVNADAIFFLFDPRAVQSIERMLQGIADAEAERKERLHPEQILANLHEVAGAVRQGGADQLPPVGVILCKFDVLQRELRKLGDGEWDELLSNPGAAYMRDQSLVSTGYDEADAELLSLEVRSLLDKLGAQHFLNAVTRTPRGLEQQHRFFAVSALGHTPRTAALSSFGLTPFRVLDPVKWVLARKGAL